MKGDYENHGQPAQNDWEQWLAEHAPAFLLYARQQSHCLDDAQDLVQEAVVESWEREANGSPPSRFVVFATIRRRAIDWARSRARRVRRELASQDETPDCWFDDRVEQRERVQLIEGIMRNLLPIYREVVVLKVWGGLTFDEIGKTLDIPVNTAASRYRYGLAELRRLSREVFR